MRLKAYLKLFFFLTAVATARAQQSEEKLSEVLILGTYHLAQIDNFQTEMLDPLVNKLDAANFNVVAIENMPLQTITDIDSREDRAFTALINKIGTKRLNFAREMQEKLNVSRVQADSMVNRLMDERDMSQTTTRTYIQHLIAAGDLNSAAMMYDRAAQQTKDQIKRNLSADLQAELFKILKSKNEINQIAIRLADLEGLKKLFYIDDLQDESILLKYYPDFIKDYQANATRVDSLMDKSVVEDIAFAKARSKKQKNLMPLYRYLNSENYMKHDFVGQWEIWFKTNFESKSDLARYYLWEMRNLSIAANILKVIARNPGKKILVVIGASHKSFLEKYLSRVSHVNLLTFNDL